MAITQIKGSNIEDGTVVAADIKDDSITNDKIKSDAAIATTKISGLAASATTDTTDASNISSGTLPTARLANTLDLSSKTVTLPAAAVTAHAVTPTLDAPVITGTLSVLDSGTVTHTIANWSDDITYTITPTNCTVGAINISGQFVITHTSGTPSYTIKSTTASLGLADSALVTKNIVMQLSAPTLSSPADSPTLTNVVYTITSTSTGDDKLVLDIGSSNFTYQSVSVGTASKVGNTVECIGFTTNNPAVTIQFTAEATYGVKAKADNIAGTYGTSSYSALDAIVIANTYTIDYLVIGGGGAGGFDVGGGGGAGGYRNSYNSETSGGGGSSETTAVFSSTVVYTITVGAGGVHSSVHSAPGGNGVSSSISGTGFTTITSLGGGGGGSFSASKTGSDGGSAGGGSGHNQASSGGSGTANQGYDGGDNTGPGTTTSGGAGGGAGGVGPNQTTGGPNIGGAGLASSITGASVTRGVGGRGFPDTGSPIAGGANTGDGGDGAGSGYAGNGGSGVVILRMLTSDYTGTTTNSPTVTTSGSDTILTFNSSGSYTA